MYVTTGAAVVKDGASARGHAPAGGVEGRSFAGRSTKDAGKHDGERYRLSMGNMVVIPAGTEHNAINTSITERPRLYIVYSPPDSASSPVKVSSTGLAHRRRPAEVGFDLYPHG